MASIDSAVERVVSGDRSAFSEIVSETTPRLFRLAARMLGDETEAEDVLQEAYVRAFDALVEGRFDARSGAFTWLYRIVANAALDAMRSRKRRRARFEGETQTEHAEEVATAERIEARAALREISAVLEQLPPDQRAAIVLKELEGMSSAEVAEVMNCSIGAVEQRLVRARATLRTRWGRD